MTCPKCNTVVSDSFKACPNCGNLFTEQSNNINVVQPQQEQQPINSMPVNQNINTYNNQQPVNAAPTKNKKANILKCILIPIVIAVVAFFLPGIVGIIYAFTSDSTFEIPTIIRMIQIVLPILIVLFGPIIMYVIEVNKK